MFLTLKIKILLFYPFAISILKCHTSFYSTRSGIYANLFLIKRNWITNLNFYYGIYIQDLKASSQVMNIVSTKGCILFFIWSLADHEKTIINSFSSQVRISKLPCFCPIFACVYLYGYYKFFAHLIRWILQIPHIFAVSKACCYKSYI